MKLDRFQRQIVTIREIPGRGWLWLEHGRQFPTAAAAASAVKRDAEAVAKHRKGVVTLITWEPVTLTGEAVVKALTGSDER